MNISEQKQILTEAAEYIGKAIREISYIPDDNLDFSLLNNDISKILTRVNESIIELDRIEQQDSPHD